MVFCINLMAHLKYKIFIILKISINSFEDYIRWMNNTKLNTKYKWRQIWNEKKSVNGNMICSGDTLQIKHFFHWNNNKKKKEFAFTAIINAFYYG